MNQPLDVMGILQADPAWPAVVDDAIIHLKGDTTNAVAADRRVLETCERLEQKHNISFTTINRLALMDAIEKMMKGTNR